MSHESPTEKVCSGCAQLRPLSEYYRQARGLYGRSSRCKACCRAYERSEKGRAIRQRYEQSEKGKEKFARYRKSGKRQESLSHWRQTPKGRESRGRDRASEAGRAGQRRYRSTPGGIAVNRAIALRAAATEKGKARIRAYRESGRRLEVQRKHKHSPKGLEASRRHCAIRRARKTRAGGEYTRAEWFALCEMYGNRCLACGGAGQLEPDHVVPIARGGGSQIANIQPLCCSCNRRKNAKTIDYRLMPMALAS